MEPILLLRQSQHSAFHLIEDGLKRLGDSVIWGYKLRGGFEHVGEGLGVIGAGVSVVPLSLPVARKEVVCCE